MSYFSETVLEHSESPRNWGKLEDPDMVGVSGVPGRGRYLVVYADVTENRITEARFQCHGCGAMIASGSVLTELIIGQSLKVCRSLTEEELLTALDGLPSHKSHSSGFAIRALQQALDHYESVQQEQGTTRSP